MTQREQSIANSLKGKTVLVHRELDVYAGFYRFYIHCKGTVETGPINLWFYCNDKQTDLRLNVEPDYPRIYPPPARIIIDDIKVSQLFWEYERQSGSKWVIDEILVSMPMYDGKTIGGTTDDAEKRRIRVPEPVRSYSVRSSGTNEKNRKELQV